MATILQIIQGATTIDLLSGGITLISWRPNPASYKDGGVFRNSVVSPGRVPIYKQNDNVIETIEIGIYGSSQDAVIATIVALKKILEAAFAFWAPGTVKSNPVYLSAKADTETSNKYAYIYKAELTELSDMYFGSFITGVAYNSTSYNSGFSNLTLTIERGDWMAVAPGSSPTAMAISNLETFNGVNYGTVDSNGTRSEQSGENDVFVSPKYSPANITHIYRFDDSAGTYSSNLVSASLPYTLFPASPAVNDAILFGISTAVSGYSPFSSLVFYISTAGAGTHTIIWEYSTGAGTWATVSEGYDGTDSSAGSGTGVFRNIGATFGYTAVSWAISSNFTAAAYNGVTAYWVRARISAFTSMSTIPQQGTSDVYSVQWPYVEVQSSTIKGDLDALIRMTIAGNHHANRATKRFIIAIRDYDRGSAFSPYLNASDVAEHLTGSSSITAGTDCAFANYVQAPVGRILRYTPTTTATMANRSIWDVYSNVYAGRYRVFLRGRRSSNVVVMTARTQVAIGAGSMPVLATGQIVTLAQTTGLITTDLGLLSIPSPRDYLSDTIGQLDVAISVQMSVSSTAETFDIWDMVLIPADEFIGDFISTSDVLSGVSWAFTLVVDGATVRTKNRAYVYTVGDPTVAVDVYQSISGQNFFLSPGKRYRIFMFAFQSVSAGAAAAHEAVLGVSLGQVARYSISAGNS